jgi:hypothetical protein
MRSSRVGLPDAYESAAFRADHRRGAAPALLLGEPGGRSTVSAPSGAADADPIEDEEEGGKPPDDDDDDDDPFFGGSTCIG